MVDLDGDGIPDVFDNFERILLMEGARIIDSYLSKRREEMQRAAQASERERMAAARRFAAESSQARMSLAPVMRDDWWDRADRVKIGERYMEAQAWARQEPSFGQYVKRIEDQALARHNLQPDQIAREAIIARRGPLDVHGARAVAMVAAPQWYRLHERVAFADPGRQFKAGQERLIKDMTRLRDEGKLDTGSAKEEWARYKEHPLLLRVRGETEPQKEWEEARSAAIDKFWDESAEERLAESVPHYVEGTTPARPFLTTGYDPGGLGRFETDFVPRWLRDAHSSQGRREENHSEWPPGVRDQYQMALEHYRDTGDFGHPYAQKMLEKYINDNPTYVFSKVDTADYWLHERQELSDADRVRFGGSPHARPMTTDETVMLVNSNAPIWYKEPVLKELGPESELTAAERMGLMAQVRSDMTVFRDRGEFNSAHIRWVWAETQENTQGQSPDRVWRETADKRAAATPISEEQKAALGAAGYYKAPSMGHAGVASKSAADMEAEDLRARSRKAKKSEKAAVVDSAASKAAPGSPGGYDSAERRAAQAREIRAKYGKDAAIAWQVADVTSAKPRGVVDAHASQAKTKARQHNLVMRQQKGRKM